VTTHVLMNWLDTRAARRCDSPMDLPSVIARRPARIRGSGAWLLALTLAGLGLGVVLRVPFLYAKNHPKALAATDNGPDDDWEVVRPGAGANDSVGPRPQSPNTRAEGAEPPSMRVFVACGERATPPSAEVATIVGRINELWGAHVRVYQTVAPMPPHAAPGGCIFYNRTALMALMGNRLQVSDAGIAGPLLYAIFAHEVGHEMHHDLDASRAGIPVQVKELEADRFAGYTMQKLDVPSGSLAPYWSMAGDEFGSGGPSHGSSGQRLDAFKQGWDLAEWNRPETSSAVPAGPPQNGYTADSASVAPDDPSGAP